MRSLSLMNPSDTSTYWECENYSDWISLIWKSIWDTKAVIARNSGLVWTRMKMALSTPLRLQHGLCPNRTGQKEVWTDTDNRCSPEFLFFLPLIVACTSWLTTGHDAVYFDPCLKAAAVLGSVFVTIFLVWLLHWHVLALSLLAGRMGRYWPAVSARECFSSQAGLLRMKIAVTNPVSVFVKDK